MKYFYGFLFFAILQSCTKILSEFDINSSNQTIVVDGLVTDSLMNHIVKLSFSTDFYKQDDEKKVESAKVIIKDDHGLIDTLKYQSNGVYKTKKWAGIPGYTYSIEIYFEDRFYFGRDIIPLDYGFSANPLEEKFREKAPTFNNYGQYNFGNIKYINAGDSVFQVYFGGRFLSKERSFYRAELYRNNYKYSNPNAFFLLDTELLTENIDDILLPGNFVKKDTVSLLIYQVSPDCYNFYVGLRQLQNYEGGIFSPPPGNPTTNISNNALGFFECSRIKKSFLVIK